MVACRLRFLTIALHRTMRRMSETAPYASLTPDRILDALDSVGMRGDGRLLGLNSYENRVYHRRDCEDAPLRSWRSSTVPARWSDAQILEEHAFVPNSPSARCRWSRRLRSRGSTLHRFGGFRFAVYPKRGGRAPELEDRETLEWMGRFIGRIHAVGALARFAQRPALDIASFGDEPRDYLLAHGFIPPISPRRGGAWSAQALDGVRRCYRARGRRDEPAAARRLPRRQRAVDRGRAGPHFVDFDDARMGPAVQDLWMLLSGERAAMARQLADVLDGYEDFHEFDRARTASGRGAAHAAPDPLFGLDRAALGRPRVSRRVPLVQHAALLAGPHSRIARADCRDGRAAFGVSSHEPGGATRALRSRIASLFGWRPARMKGRLQDVRSDSCAGSTAARRQARCAETPIARNVRRTLRR